MTMPVDKLLVKNMVCHRCVLSVEAILKNASIPFEKVTIGEVSLAKPLDDEEISKVKEKLAGVGLELIDNKMSGLIERIKSLVIKKARNETGEADSKLKLSTYLSHHLHHEYTYLSSLFSSVEGRTIESYFIEQRIEKVKELLVYGEMTLSEISYALEYSSVAHLSSQFKKITGLTPSHFKKIGSAKRRLLDQV
jgi:AraC family transcriptional regulator